jgi:rhamnosyl/mannosyltransferase
MYASRLGILSSAPLSLDFPRRLAREYPDIAHLHFPYPMGEAAHYFLGRARKTVLTYHSDIVRQKYGRVLYSPLLHRVLTRVDTIIATSPNYIASSPILSRWKKKCVVVPLGIDLRPFSLPRSMEEGGAGDNLLVVGQLRYYKGLNYLLRAMRELPNARLVVVGTGPMESAWKNLTRGLGLTERVRFVGEVSDAELSSYYAACDIFVLPASERSEAFGVVQLEAMAAGKPVVSCDVGTGVAWVNQNEVTGFVVPPRDSHALAMALKQLIANDELREKMGAAGQARVQAEFTSEKMVERVLRVYSEK